MCIRDSQQFRAVKKIIKRLRAVSYTHLDVYKRQPKKGDVLITAVGTLGIIYIIKEEDCKFYFKDGNLLWIKDPDESMIDVEFLFHAFEPVFTKQRDVMIIGTSQNALTIEKMKCLQLPLPPLPEPVSYTHLDVYKRQEKGSRVLLYNCTLIAQTVRTAS